MLTVETQSRVFVAGHRGLVGSALVRRLEREGFDRILTASRREVDLRDQAEVDRWFEKNRPELVFVAAATVGGILPNSTRPADSLYDNLMIHANIVHAEYRSGVRRLLYLGSSCIYPREAPQPLREEYLLTGRLEWLFRLAVEPRRLWRRYSRYPLFALLVVLRLPRWLARRRPGRTAGASEWSGRRLR